MCIFCKIGKGEIPSYRVYEDDVCTAFLDLGAMTKGHTLVVPKNHYKDIYDLDADVAKHLITVCQKIAVKLKSLGCKGVNIINNNGAVAGQTTDHFHIHLIPRYEEDEIKFSFKENKFSEEEFENIKNLLKKA